MASKKAIITSALPYANGEIHLGHVASTYLPADVTCRYLKLNGVEAYYICASDDFGTPILIQAEREGITPYEYVARWNKQDQEDFENFGIKFDYFSQTSSACNVQFVQDVFTKLNDAGHIFEQEIVQFYCEKDAKFLPDRYVKGTCPSCGAVDQYSDLCEVCSSVPEEIQDPKCAICGATPTKKRSNHAFFRLSSFADDLSKWLDGNNNLQKDVKRYVQNWISSGLSDWDITRDISWGVPVPLPHYNNANDKEKYDNSVNYHNTEESYASIVKKVFYGWFDNHLAYISSTMEFLETKGIDGHAFWNAADIYHFIGKDIVYHHYLFLPAMRLGINSEYKLPDFIPTRGHLTLQSKKISKSRNWYIGLREFLQYYPADYLRYYLASINPYSQDDINFDWDEFAIKINSELIGNLGNFVNRVLGFTTKKFDGVVPETDLCNNDAHLAKEGVCKDDRDHAAFAQILALETKVETLMTQNHIDRALRKVMEFSSHFNQYFQHKEPWRGNTPATENCIYISVNAVYAIAIAMYPFLPNSACKIWSQLGLDSKSKLEDSSWSDMSNMAIKPGHHLGSVSPLFERVDEQEIEQYKQRLGHFVDASQ